MNLYSTKGT